MRADWDSYFLSIAKLAATRATCNRAHHGAIIVRDKAIISTGYNGAPRRIESCEEKKTCVRELQGAKPGERYELCISVHAEQNAINLAARNGSSTLGCTLYVTGLPCLMCARSIINAGIAVVIFDNSEDRYKDQGTMKLFMQAGVKCKAHI